MPFLAENYRKSQKIVIITLTPVLQKGISKLAISQAYNLQYQRQRVLKSEIFYPF
jgi:hypothetical protein